MKHMKKAFALILALAMVLTMSAVTAFAAEGESSGYTIAVKNDVAGFTYNAYQIFTGDLSEGTLSNVAWGSGITDAGKKALYSKYSLTGANQTAAKVAEAIASDTSSTAAADVATLLAKTTTSGIQNPITMTRNESISVGESTFKGYAATNQAAGWYLIVNSAVPTGDQMTYSDYIVQVVQDVAVEPKSGKPESVKKLKDVNDSEAASATNPTSLQDSADYDIGDDIPYTLTFTLPADYANYDAYAVTFLDDMSKGLTYNNDAKIYLGTSDTKGTAITLTQDNTAKSAYTGGKVYKYSIANLKTDDYKTYNLAAGSVIRIEYTAKLNADAVVGEAGNPNKYRVEFSNNPNGESTGTTPWDTNIVFTYQVVFNKVDENKNALTGADFTLYKFVVSSEGTDTYGEGESTLKGTWTDVTALNGSNGTNPTKTKSASAATEAQGTEGEEGYVPEKEAVQNSVFTFKGLDDGVYKLSETTTPGGYNTMADKVFTITAAHVVEADNPTLTSLSASGDLAITGTTANGTLSADIENQKGSELPTTGGIGTVIFYVLGAALVIGCGIALISKRRVSSK